MNYEVLPRIVVEVAGGVVDVEGGVFVVEVELQLVPRVPVCRDLLVDLDRPVVLGPPTLCYC